MVRQVRHDAMKEIATYLTNNEIGEDEKKGGEKKVQELTDEMIAELDAMEQKKEQELMQV